MSIDNAVELPIRYRIGNILDNRSDKLTLTCGHVWGISTIRKVLFLPVTQLSARSTIRFKHIGFSSGADAVVDEMSMMIDLVNEPVN